MICSFSCFLEEYKRRFPVVNFGMFTWLKNYLWALNFDGTNILVIVYKMANKNFALKIEKSSKVSKGSLGRIFSSF